MEDNILKIMGKHLTITDYMAGIDGVPEAAKEIAAHVMEFIEWKDKNIVWDNFNNKFLNRNTGDFTKTNNELYQYFLTNIKK